MFRRRTASHRLSENGIVWSSPGCLGKEVIDMKRRFETSKMGTLKNPARLPVQTEDLTAVQTAQISGGAIRWRNILRDLFGIDLGTNPPETGAAGLLM